MLPPPPPPPPPTFPLPKAGPILTTTAADDHSSYPSLAIIAAIICFAILAASFIHFLLRCRRRRIHHLYSSSSLSSSSSSSSIPRSPNPPPPPPPPPPTFPLPKAGPILTTTAADDHSSYPSLAIIAAIICFAILAASFIHFLLRCRRRRIHHLYSSSSLSSSSSSSSIPRSPNPPPSDLDPKVVIDSLPLFSLASSNLKPSASLDCAVCLSLFRPSDELRLLPSCCHAFHSHCIDTWLNSNLSCPLCRSPVLPAPPTAPSTPPLESLTSESFRLEIGSISHRTTDHPSASHVRSYSLGSSFNYVVDDDIDEVLASVRRVPAMEKFEAETPPAQPGAEVAAAVGGESQRSWLREYVDRLASSASSSFSSLRLSQRWSRRFDSAAVGGDSWDLERNLHLHLEEDDGGFAAFYRWLVGA